ncbi:hypothetical protein M8J76_011584 [Diaphorina citri]|nr:hypothetical protein M8J76_011584 [Diaphorina citri]
MGSAAGSVGSAWRDTLLVLGEENVVHPRKTIPSTVVVCMKMKEEEEEEGEEEEQGGGGKEKLPSPLPSGYQDDFPLLLHGFMCNAIIAPSRDKRNLPKEGQRNITTGRAPELLQETRGTCQKRARETSPLEELQSSFKRPEEPAKRGPEKHHHWKSSRAPSRDQRNLPKEGRRNINNI